VSSVLLAAFLALDLVEPLHQEFSLQNYTLWYTYAVKERVPNAVLVVIAVACPAGVIAFYTIVLDGLFSNHKASGSWRGKYKWAERFWELNCGWLGLGLAISLQYVVVGMSTSVPRYLLGTRC
jgi:diacylglycerol diphosphate phosphatase/phosphatidate phosphatase